MNMKRSIFLLILLLAGWGCQKDAKPVPDQTAARVGNQTITEADINDRLALMSDEDREFAKTAIGRQNLLQIITREKLISAAAKDEGLEQSDVYLSIMEDKRAQLADIYRQFGEQTLEQLWYDELREKGDTAVTDEERIVQAHFLSQRRDIFGTRLLTKDRFSRIARGQVKNKEYQQGNTDQYWNQCHKTFNDKLDHAVDPLLSLL